MKMTRTAGVACAVSAFWLVACASDRSAEQPTTPSATPAAGEAAGPRAEAELQSAEGAQLEGKATFIQEPDGVRVVVEVEDAPPGRKGVHVHERGDCSDIAGQSMGPHFAPQLEQHALPSEGDARHLGDLGNIEVSPDGRGRLEIKVDEASLAANDERSFLGRALVVHSGEDSGSAVQPSGGSGAPMACGVIERG